MTDCPVCGQPLTYYADRDIEEFQCGRHTPPYIQRVEKRHPLKMGQP